ncbi:MAG: hypothetical protein ACXAEX_01780 [Promethearchaeota archaeon]
MKSNDFDSDIQEIFNSKFSDIQSTNWRNWLELSSKEDYIELVLNNSGLATIEDIFERITQEKSNSKDLSITLHNYIMDYNKTEPLILCHSSGTTDSNISALKWFHMSKKTAQRYWAPGMQAIFESSGLNSDSSVIIFVPSRLHIDGIKSFKQKKYVSLYSSEFSQRLMLSIVKPHSYTFFEYKNSKNLSVISKILSLDNVSVISAPAATILGWADIDKFQLGLEKSLKSYEDTNEPLFEKIRNKGIKVASREIQKMLSDKLYKATLVFSISSLSEEDWDLIRKFMNWQKGKEKFTNLYVASEMGPFAASIDKKEDEPENKTKLNVFPLTFPVIESKGKKQFISDSSDKIGKLLISRINNSKAYINLDIGDVIRIVNQHNLPQIEGNILRSSFRLKYPIKISKRVTIPKIFEVYAGEYFALSKFDIYNPRYLLNCLKLNCELDYDNLLLINHEKNGNEHWKLFLLTNETKMCSNIDNYKKTLLSCIKEEKLKKAINDNIIKLELIDENPVNFLATRSIMLERVRNGKNPKGILKKWPLYVIKA